MSPIHLIDNRATQFLKPFKYQHLVAQPHGTHSVQPLATAVNVSVQSARIA
jgi:hypothetical protein